MPSKEDTTINSKMIDRKFPVEWYPNLFLWLTDLEMTTCSVEEVECSYTCCNSDMLFR